MSGDKMRPEFYHLNGVTMTPAASREDLAEALRAADSVQERHRLAEAAVYASACRRYLLMTGKDWKAEQQPEGAAIWTESDHRFRVKTHHGMIAQCSCGASENVCSEPDALEWHEEHLEEVAG